MLRKEAAFAAMHASTKDIGMATSAATEAMAKLRRVKSAQDSVEIQSNSTEKNDASVDQISIFLIISRDQTMKWDGNIYV